MYQITRFKGMETVNTVPAGIAWRKVNWRDVEKKIRNVAKEDGT